MLRRGARSRSQNTPRLLDGFSANAQHSWSPSQPLLPVATQPVVLGGGGGGGGGCTVAAMLTEAFSPGVASRHGAVSEADFVPSGSDSGAAFPVGDRASASSQVF